MVLISLYNLYDLFPFCMYNFFALEAWQVQPSIVAYFVEIDVWRYSVKKVFLELHKIHIFLWKKRC